MLKTVVLPAPFGPIRPTRSREPTWRSNSPTAVRPPKRMVHFFRSRSVPLFIPSLRCALKFRPLLDRADLSFGGAAREHSEKSLWSQQHQCNQDEGVDDHAIGGDAAHEIGQPLIARDKAEI